MSLRVVLPALEAALGAAGRLRRRLHRRGGGRGRRGAARGRRAAAGEHPLPQGRGGERSGVRSGAGGARAMSTATTPSRRRTGRTPRPRALARLLPACAGRLMQAELEALEKALGKPERPVVAVVGGAKVSTKLELLGNLIGKVDTLVIGGGMANTFLAAQGIDVGKSLCEHDLAGTARRDRRKGGGGGVHDPAAGRRGRRAGIQGRGGARDRAGQGLPGGRDDPRRRAGGDRARSRRRSRRRGPWSGTARSARSRFRRSTPRPTQPRGRLRR